MSFREIVPGVFNVGCLDPLEREFHVHEIGRGTSYNSFLIKDTKICIIDTVKENFCFDFVANVKACLAGKQGEEPDDSILEKVEVIYVLHTEQDHNGSLRYLHSKCPNAEIVIGKKGRDNLLRWFPESKDWKIKVVANGEKYSLGETSLELLETPLLHWTDSTFAYMREKKIFFTSDAFGQHIGNNTGTDSDIGEDDLLIQMKVYYAQVFAQVIQPTLKMVADCERVSTGKATPVTAGEEYKAPIDLSGIDGLLPAHGLCLLRKSTIERSMRLYRRWAQQIPTRKVIILYESIYDTTGKMARKLKSTIEACSAGALTEAMEKEPNPHPPTPVVVELMCARRNTVLDVVHEVLDAPVVLFGTATFNNMIMPNLRKLLHVIQSYRFKPKATFAFGSYGWSPLAVKDLEKIITTDFKWTPIHDTVSCINEVDDGVMKKLEEAGIAAYKAACEKGLPGTCLTL